MGRSSGHRVPWPTAVTVIADMGTDRPQPGHSLPPHATESIVYLCGDKRVVGSGSLVWYSTLNNRAERHEIHPIFPLDGDGTSRAGLRRMRARLGPFTPAGRGRLVRRGPIMLVEHSEENVVTCHPVSGDRGPRPGSAAQTRTPR